MQDRKNTFQSFLQYNFAASLSWLEFSKEIRSENRHWITSECEKKLYCAIYIARRKIKKNVKFIAQVKMFFPIRNWLITAKKSHRRVECEQFFFAFIDRPKDQRISMYFLLDFFMFRAHKKWTETFYRKKRQQEKNKNAKGMKNVAKGRRRKIITKT